MNREIIERINALDAQNDKELVEAIENAKSIDEIVAILNAKGVNVTAEDLTGEITAGELTEESLEAVAGGGKFNWGGFKSGFNDGYGGSAKNGSSLWYCIGYGVGSFLR